MLFFKSTPKNPTTRDRSSTMGISSVALDAYALLTVGAMTRSADTHAMLVLGPAAL